MKQQIDSDHNFNHPLIDSDSNLMTINWWSNKKTYDYLFKNAVRRRWMWPEKTSPCNWQEKSQNHDEARRERWATMSLLPRKDSENYEQRETEIGGENVAVQLAGKITKSWWSTLGTMSLLLRKDSFWERWTTRDWNWGLA
jgi:hypothetical protein